MSILFHNQGAAAVTLTGILAALINVSGAQHPILDAVLVSGIATFPVADDGHGDLLQVAGRYSVFLNESPAGDDCLQRHRAHK